MKQLLQSVRDGSSVVAEVPVPHAAPGTVLVRTRASLVSAGTERMAIEFGEKNLLEKARSRPDLVRQVIDKARVEGWISTVEAAFNRLDRPLALGYSSSGTVVEVGTGVTAFHIGDRVACAGMGYACHAEFAQIPKNLLAAIPQATRNSGEVEFEEAAFATIGAIALHGFRLSELQVGETVAVIGLGLIGLVAIQIARAAGCQVIGFDPDESRCAIAEKLGFTGTANDEEVFASNASATRAGGADAVLITAATSSDAPVALAARVARDRGRVVAIGAVGTSLPRKNYYEKELDFRVSRSYGPGRYDSAFEEKGQDYPLPYVRWTETRNIEAFLQLVADDRVNVRELISHRFSIDQASRAYEIVSGKTDEKFLGIVLQYAEASTISRRINIDIKGAPTHHSHVAAACVVSVLGAGNFANAVLLPALKRAGAELRGVCAGGGASARHAAEKFRFQFCATDPDEVLDDAETNTIVIATRHHLHATQVVASLNAGKHVFVEKPLALNEDELQQIVHACEQNPSRLLMVGFNRRFAPLAQPLKKFLSCISEPLVLQYRINAGSLPPNHWTQDENLGGGRIIGEVCHFIDFSTWMMGQLPFEVRTEPLSATGSSSYDNVVITLRYANGSAVITYLANGDKSAGKERIELHGGGRSAVLEDFRRLQLVSGGRRRTIRNWLRQDKGHDAECQAFVNAVRKGSPAPISLAEMVSTTRATFLALESARRGTTVELQSGSAAGRMP